MAGLIALYAQGLEMIECPMRYLLIFSVFFMLIPATALAAGSYGYSADNEVVGVSRYHRVVEGETLFDIARQYNLGFNEVKAANPDMNPWVPGVGKRVVLPTKWVLPESYEDYDVIINLAEMRLYRFFDSPGGRRLVSSYPIGVAIDGFATPLGDFVISEKVARPTWYVPASVKRENPSLPDIVPPGDENPLGQYALRLSNTNYFIHGTNKPAGIGMRVSHGCIRLYPEDIVELYHIVGLGAKVKIVYAPVKAGIKAGRVYLEIHDDYLGRVEDLGVLVHDVLAGRGLLGMVDSGRIEMLTHDSLGMPIVAGDMLQSVEATKKSPGTGVPGDSFN